MRTFGKELTEYFEFQLEDDEKVYRIPLGGSLTNRELIAFKNTNGDYEAQLEWLRAYIGDVVDDLTPFPGQWFRGAGRLLRRSTRPGP